MVGVETPDTGKVATSTVALASCVNWSDTSWLLRPGGPRRIAVTLPATYVAPTESRSSGSSRVRGEQSVP